MSETAPNPPDFIRAIVIADQQSNKHDGKVITRFPPEPNGWLHIGHAKSICLNFGVAAEFGGRCHLRFDDTNPLGEDAAFEESIERDIRWLGFEWGEHHYHASDYFEQLYQFALELIEKRLAYVCEQSEEEMRAFRGTVKEPGRPSPFRDRPTAESIDLFRRMRGGEFPDGSRTLRAKIDMAADNMKMRDPIVYRIRHMPHHRSGDAWPIYPMYDFAHCLSDAIEHITHSLCTLEFDNNRELYDWYVANVSAPSTPRQIEFARLNVTYMVTSKRRLLRLVTEGHVEGWDDPRMPTLAAMRRRGYPPAAIRDFCTRAGVAKRASVVDYAQLAFSVREELNRTAPRVMAVLEPLKVVIENYPEGKVEEIEAINNPEDAAAGTRKLPFSRELYIEHDDFLEDPPKKYHRLSPGREVRLKHGYFVTCQRAVKDPTSGEVVELRCTYDPETGGGSAPDGRSPKGTIHWVSAAQSLAATVRIYEHLLTIADMDEVEEGRDFIDYLNPDSLQVLEGCRVEPGLGEAKAGDTFQFLRHGYFCVDPSEGLVFNRTVALRDSWAKEVKKQNG